MPVQVTVAMNGQDFNDVQSDAYVTFVGTGSDSGWLKILIFVLLLVLLILAIVFCCFAASKPNMYQQKEERKSHSI